EDVRPKLRQKRFDVASTRERAGRVVGIADVYQSRGRIDRGQHRLEIMRVIIHESNAREPASGTGDYRLKPVEAWRGHHDLVAPAGQRLDGGTKDLAGARAQDNAIELDAANARDLTPQQLGFRFRIPVHQACRPFYRCDDLR